MCSNEAEAIRSETLKCAGIKEISLVANGHNAFPTPMKIEDDDPLLSHTMKELEMRHKLEAMPHQL